MKMLPAAYMPASGRLMRASFLATFLRKACGICNRMPAPSPVLTSLPLAPR
jgi:hypothetical protein